MVISLVEIAGASAVLREPQDGILVGLFGVGC